MGSEMKPPVYREGAEISSNAGTTAFALGEVERFLKRGNLERKLDDEDDEVEDLVSADDNESIDVSESDLDGNGGPVAFMSPKNSVANRTASV